MIRRPWWSEPNGQIWPGPQLFFEGHPGILNDHRESGPWFNVSSWWTVLFTVQCPCHYTGVLGPTQTTGWAPPAGLTNTSSSQVLQSAILLLLSSPTLRTLQTLPPPTIRFDPLAWSSGSDQRRISGCGIRWLLAGPDSLPLWLCHGVCAFVLLRCFSCSHTVLPKEHSLGVIFFPSLDTAMLYFSSILLAFHYWLYLYDCVCDE